MSYSTKGRMGHTVGDLYGMVEWIVCSKRVVDGIKCMYPSSTVFPYQITIKNPALTCSLGSMT